MREKISLKSIRIGQLHYEKTTQLLDYVVKHLDEIAKEALDKNDNTGYNKSIALGSYIKSYVDYFEKRK